MRLAGASAAEGLLSVEELLAWALPRLADGGADSGHAAAAAVLPLLQASLWVRTCGRCHGHWTYIERIMHLSLGDLHL